MRWVEGRVLTRSALLGAFAALIVSACGAGSQAPTVVIDMSNALDEGIVMALGDVHDDLERVTGEAPLRGVSRRRVGCVDRRIRLTVVDAAVAAATPLLADLGPQEYAIHEERCGSEGRWLRVAGGSALAVQWALYDLLQRLGIRYFHPESTFYPEALEWPDTPLRVREGPSMGRRTMHAHRRHPIELSGPLGESELDMAGYQRRWIDWSVKMRQTAVDGWDRALVGDYAYRRGFPRVVGLNLANSQQGAQPLLDADDPRPEAEQLARAVDRLMAAAPDLPTPRRLEVQFNPSEFTEIDHERTLVRLFALTEHFERSYPEATIEAINHGTYAEPQPPYGRRFFDLPALAPSALGVQIHTLMFYDLERSAAGVYGNVNYNGLYEFLKEEQSRRRIVHYPESSWWLTFDLPVPLYLAPVTIDARAHDIALLRPYLTDDPKAKSGVVGHHLFTSGQEWGYWMVDYCVAQMTWDADSSAEQCIEEIVDSFAESEVLTDVLASVRERQVDDLRDPRLLRLLVGSDDETEAGAALGIVVHPLPPRPSEVAALDDREALELEVDLAVMGAMAADFHAWADRVDATLPAQPSEARPWVEEIADGLRVFALRAEHAVAIYRGALALRRGDLGHGAAEQALEEARSLTSSAREVIRRREGNYRYPPALTIDGDERGRPGAVRNRTVYPFRVLSRTHRLFYWERPERQLAALLEADRRWLVPSATILPLGGQLSLRVDPALRGDLSVTWGDESVESGLTEHAYAATGRYPWRAQAEQGENTWLAEGEVVVVERCLAFPQGSVVVDEPRAAAQVEGLLPGLLLGISVDPRGEPAMVLAEVDGEPTTTASGVVWRPFDGSRSGPSPLEVRLRGIGELEIADAILRFDAEQGGEAAPRLEITGLLVTDNLVRLLVGSGSFEPPGARSLLAELFGYSDDELPAMLPLRAHALGSRECAGGRLEGRG